METSTSTIFRPLVPAKKIRRLAHGDGQIESYVNDLIELVNDRIENAVENGNDHVFVEIQTLFDVPHIKNSDVQRNVYYWVLKSITDADYKVRIIFRGGNRAESQRVFLLVRWFKKQDKELRDHMDDYIKKHTAKSHVNASNSNDKSGRVRKKNIKKTRK